MDTTQGLTSYCRHCRFYTPEGRRGGNCGQLGVTVSGTWRSCSLSMPPFAPSWESAFPPLPQRLPKDAVLTQTVETLEAMETIELQPISDRSESVGQTFGQTLGQNVGQTASLAPVIQTRR